MFVNPVTIWFVVYGQLNFLFYFILLIIIICVNYSSNFQCMSYFMMKLIITTKDLAQMPCKSELFTRKLSLKLKSKKYIY